MDNIILHNHLQNLLVQKQILFRDIIIVVIVIIINPHQPAMKMYQAMLVKLVVARMEEVRRTMLL